MKTETYLHVYSIFDYVLDLLSQTNDGFPDRRKISSDLRARLAAFDIDGAQKQQFDLTKSALVYWVDEVLVTSDWPHAEEWRDNTLERQLYDSRDRAWQFFERAKEARNLTNLDALEVFFLCAGFGFRGLYREDRLASRHLGGTESDSDEQNTTTGSTDTAQDDTDEDQSTEEKQNSSWWSGEDENMSQNKTWGIGGDDLPKLLEQLKDDANPNMSLRLDIGNDSFLPPTLEEWADAAYQQLKESSQDTYTPEREPDTLNDASPLMGSAFLRLSRRVFRSSIILSVITLVAFLYFTAS